MNKKLLAVAVGAALSAAPMLAAQADVNFFGRFQAEVGQVSNDGGVNFTLPRDSTAITGGNSETTMGDAAQGRWGIDASEDLGGGMKGIGRVEYDFDTTDGNPTTNARHMYVGLAHKAFGTLKFGRMDGAYKSTSASLDPYIATRLEARNNYGMAGNADGYGIMNGAGGYLTKMVQYISPSIVGLQLDIAVGVEGAGNDHNCAVTSTTGTAGNLTRQACAQGTNTRGDISAALTWKGGPARVFVGYAKDANAVTIANNNPEPVAIKAGAQLKFGKGITHTINLQWETVSRDAVDNAFYGADAAYIFLGYHLGINAFTISLQGGSFADSSTATGTYYMVGGRYNFSKTTSAFFGYRHSDFTADNLTAVALAGGGTATDPVDNNYYGIGLRKDF